MQASREQRKMRPSRQRGGGSQRVSTFPLAPKEFPRSFLINLINLTHQMTGNYMWDEVSNKEFLIGTNPDSRLSLWWNGSEPLWVTLQNVGKNVFMYFWPGDVGVTLASLPVSMGATLARPPVSVGETLASLLVSVDMAAVYYEKIDVEGHHFGPESPQVRTAVQKLDLIIQILNQKIKVMMLNVLLFSDHGMAKIQWMEKVIELDKFIDMSDVLKIMDRGPVVSLWPKNTTYQKVYAALSQVHNMRVYARQEIPERFHYRKGNFVSPLTLVAEPGWFITKPSAWQNGWHGYDNEFVDMRGFFLAVGPGSIRAVDVYNVMCWILGVDPLPNNGSWSRVEYLLNGFEISSSFLCRYLSILDCLFAAMATRFDGPAVKDLRPKIHK
uniref:glycerophosphocholine cholinephosphodiesterase n=1 Tax=Fundulus heteroclitus TaxID=8078 RepID=A0A3Q2QBX1_FUNHE